MKEKLNYDLKTVGEVNFDFLRKILADNVNTEYGIKHNFSKIKTIEDYRKYVPLSDYYDFKQYVDRMYEGEKNVLTAYPLETFVTTSGTVSEPKRIPLTKKSLEGYFTNKTLDKEAIIQTCRKKDPLASKLYVGFLGTNLMKSCCKEMLLSDAVYRYACVHGYSKVSGYVGGKDLLFIENTLNIFYVRLWSAILDEHVISIEGVYMYDLLQFFKFFEEKYEEIISNIRNGFIPDDLVLSDNVRKKLLELPVSEERLSFVEKECKKGFEGIASRVWPKVKFAYGISSRVYEYQNKSLDRYLGNVPKIFSFFAMSESLVGIPVEYDSFEYEFIYDSAFYEFIAYDERGNYRDEVVSIDEVQSGRMYELVVTNLSGFYRYKTGDVIKIVSNFDEKVTFEFMFRKNLVLNLAGEKISGKHIELAMQKMDDVVPDILEYSVGAKLVDNVGKYFVFLCVKSTDISSVESNISEKFDLFLCEANYLYKELRTLNLIDKPVVYVYSEEKYFSLTNKKTAKKRHNKPINILSSKNLQVILERQDEHGKDFY